MTELASFNDKEINIEFEKNKSRDAAFHTSNGFAGNLYTRKDTGESVYVTFRNKNNMYGKKNSYCLSVSIVEKLKEKRISIICVVEDLHTMYLFDVSAYENGDKIDYQGYDEQYAPPITSAYKTYERSVSAQEHYPDKFTV